MSLRIEARREISRTMLYLTPPLSVALTVAVGAVMFALMGYDPPRALHAFFVAPLLSAYSLSELAVKAAPLVLIAVGLAAGFRANVWNIGAEGQLIMGAIAGGGVGLLFWGQEGFWILPLMGLAGVLGGMAWAAIPAFLKARFDVNEILTSLMLTYVASLTLSTLVFGPWKDPEGFNFPQSRMFSDSAVVPVLVEGTRMHAGVLVALVVAVVAWIVMTRTLTGFQIRAVGLAPAAARYAGFDRRRTIWLTMLAGGGLAGLAGLFEVAGPIGQLIPTITPGYGFTAIIVAFLGRLSPVGILVAALVIALTTIGGEGAQIGLKLPLDLTRAFQGLLLALVLGADALSRYQVRLVPGGVR